MTHPVDGGGTLVGVNRVVAPSVISGPPVVSDRVPLEYVVLQLPEDAVDLPAEVARELVSLVDVDMVKVIDLVVVRRGETGELSVVESDALGPREVLRRFEDDLRVVLSEQDLARAAAAVVPGSTAAVVVWEEAWSEPLVESARRSGGRMLGSGRVAGQLPPRRTTPGSPG